MKLTIVLKKQDAIGLGGQILEAMGMHRSIYEPEVFVVQHVQDPRLVAPVDVTESMWPLMYLEALMDEGIKPLRVYQKDNSTLPLTPLFASTGGRDLSRSAVADMLDAAANALDADCGCEEGTCQCGDACEPGPDGTCLACGLPMPEAVENYLTDGEGEAPNVLNEIVETAPLNAGKVSADSPEPVAILSALGKIPGVVSADQSDSWRESDGVYWYNCTLKLEPTIRKSAKAYRNGPIIQVVTEFKNKPLSVAKAAKKAVEAAGGYNIQVSTPNRKKAWVDPEFPRDESEASSYFENGAAVRVEFLWQPGEASASVHPAVANAIKALGAVADMLEAEAETFEIQKPQRASAVKSSKGVIDMKTWKMIREKANDALEKAGFDGNGRFRNIGQANSKLADVLSNFGLQLADVMSADRFREDARVQNFGLEFVNPMDSFSPVAFDDSMVHYSYTKLSPDRVEVVAYLS